MIHIPLKTFFNGTLPKIQHKLICKRALQTWFRKLLLRPVNPESQCDLLLILARECCWPSGISSPVSFMVNFYLSMKKKSVFLNYYRGGSNFLNYFREETHIHTCVYIHAHMYLLTLHTEFTFHIILSQQALPFLKASSAILAQPFSLPVSKIHYRWLRLEVWRLDKWGITWSSIILIRILWGREKAYAIILLFKMEKLQCTKKVKQLAQGTEQISVGEFKSLNSHSLFWSDTAFLPSSPIFFMHILIK